MARDFGPWVRMDWCPTCNTSTEQTRWHSFVARDSPLNGVKVRCNSCLHPVPSGLGEIALGLLARAAGVDPHPRAEAV